MGSSTNDSADVTAVSQILIGLLQEIVRLNKELDKKSWYFSGKKIKQLVHGTGTDTDTKEYDGETKEYVADMWYNPRYDPAYVTEYNQTYYKYAIAVTESGGYEVVDLLNNSTHLQKYIQNQSSDDFPDAVTVCAAAYAMNKLEVTAPDDADMDSTEWASTIENILKYPSNTYKEFAADVMTQVKKLTTFFGNDGAFTYYKASISNRNLWYETQNDEEYIEKLVQKYESLVAELLEIASEAASNGGTIVNCVTNSFSNITDTSDSYISISQVLVCIANNTDIVIGNQSDDDVNFIISSLETVAKQQSTKEYNKKATISCVVICVIIILVWVFEMIVIGVITKKKQKKFTKVATKAVANEGASEGVKEGINEGVNEGVNEGANEGTNEGVNEGVNEDIATMST